MVRDTYLLFESGSIETKRLLDQTYFVHVCQSCRQPFFLVYPLRIRFEKASLVLSQQSAAALSQEQKTVVCRTPQQFCEAFSMLAFGLDLKKTLALKRALEAKKGAPCRIESLDEKQQILWFSCQGESVGVPINLGELTA